MVNSADFAKRLEQLFQYYELSASSFAEKINVGRASISHLLSGRNKPSLDFVMKVVQTFPEVELYWLLNGKGNFPKQDTATKVQKERLAPTTLFTEQENSDTQNNPVNSKTESENAILSEEKTIQRIVIFYTDGTFEAFNQS